MKRIGAFKNSNLGSGASGWASSLRAPWRTLSDAANLRLAKVWVTMIGLSLAFSVGGFHYGDRYGLLLGFIAALSMNAYVLFYDELRLNSLFKSTDLEGNDPWGLLRTAREVAARLETPLPQLKLIRSKTPIAYSTGVFPSRSTLFLSTELVERLTPEEARSIVALEIAKVKLYQTCTATVSSAFGGILARAASLIDSILSLRFLSQRSNHLPGPTMGPCTWLVSPLVAFLIRLTVSQRLVLQADRTAAQALEDNHALARALWKLDSYLKTRPVLVLLADAHLFTISPLMANRRFGWMAIQPSIETRIRALTGHFPL